MCECYSLDFTNREINVHKAIVCSNSTFFEAACNSAFQESLASIIRLPTQTHQTMSNVLEYLYKGDYELPMTKEEDAEGVPIRLVEIFQAAIFLGIDKLKKISIGKLIDDMYFSPREKIDVIRLAVHVLDALCSNSASADRDFPEFKGLLYRFMSDFSSLVEHEELKNVMAKHWEIGFDLAKEFHKELQRKVSQRKIWGKVEP